MSHGAGKKSSILFTAKVQPPHLFGIPPLVEGWCGLIILYPFDNGTVDHHLLVSLHFAAHHSEGVGRRVVIDLDAAVASSVRSRRYPPLVAVIIHHDCRPHLADT